MTEKSEIYRRTIGKWRVATFVLFLLTLGLLLAVLIVVFVKNRMIDEKTVPPCGSAKKVAIQLGEPANPPVFHDLTKTEMSGLMAYLYKQPTLNLVKASKAMINTSYVFTAEIYLPPKQQVLHYLDHGSARPVREAVVTIFRGDKKNPYIQEIIVGPLPDPSYMKDVPGRMKKIPFNYRPFTTPELLHLFKIVKEKMHSEAEDLIKESFDASMIDCGVKCIGMFWPVPVSPAVSGENKRYTWINFEHMVEFPGLYPLDFAVLIEHNFVDVIFHQVWYNGKMYDSIEDLVQQYNSDTIDKIRVSFPLESHNFASMKTRGKPFEEEFVEDPIQVSPGGKRYTVEHNHVEYRGWSFDYRFSTLGGTQLYDIRFKGERIAYELSLQEIMVMYSGHKPSQMFADYFDTLTLLGIQAKGMVKGVDCPTDATYMDVNHLVDFSDEPITYKNVLCLFEWNTGVPLRRHYAEYPHYGGFYEGLPNVVLTLRVMYTVVNYDYIFDFMFYQNGVIQVKAVSTGYIMATTPNPSEAPYGTQVHDNLQGPMHVHFFNFKADIDIKGTINRYETLNIVPTSVTNTFLPNPANDYHQTRYTRNLQKFELDAVYKFNFEEPKYLIFYNNQTKNQYGVPKAYRIMSTGMAKQLFAKGYGNEPSASWTRYQMAVTKQKDTERSSSSQYAYLDSANPVVQFQKYLDDNDTIVDQDLVAWLTLGVHHIPHTEDLPVTPSPGMDLSFYLLPYNYFPEDPAMASRHAVRVEYKNKQNPADGVKITRYGPEQASQCVAPKNDYFDLLKKYNKIIL